MQTLLKLSLLFVCMSLFPLAAADEPKAPRNVILMIGDGMGFNQLVSARYLKGPLAVENMKHMGVSHTHSLSSHVTDSSASATALASGYLIVNGEVGMHPDGTPTKLIVEYAEEQGKWTGLVATCRITHATPASMVAHLKSRGSEDDIAVQIAQSEVDVILGGGWDKFLPGLEQKNRLDLPPLPIDTALLKDAESLFASFRDHRERSMPVTAEVPLLKNNAPYGTRTDGRNLIGEMTARGYRFIRTGAELSLITSGPPGKVLGLFHSGPMAKVSEGRTPSLSAMSVAALKILSQSPKGFFLMIEGSQIDWGGHANDFDYTQNEAADFDTAIGAVLRHLKDNDMENETLVVITADHETGGLSLNGHPQLALGMEPKWTTTSHTGAPVPVFSAGPLAEQFLGIQDHERIGRRLIEAVVGSRVQFRYPPSPPSAPTAMPPSRRF